VTPEEVSLDEAPDGFRRLLKSLEKQRTKTTRSQANFDAIRELSTAWTRDYRPGFVAALGELPAIERVDAELSALRGRLGATLEVRELRRSLRAIATTIENEILPAYEAARWTQAVAPPPQRATTNAVATDPVVERLEALNPGLARSYRQALVDIEDTTRESYLGPAGELREVLRGAITALTPDDETIKEQPWFKGHEGKPTQAERVRFIMQQRPEGHGPAGVATELVEEKTGALGRDLYVRASRALHSGTEREEVVKIEVYVRGVLLDVLPSVH
jgi:hypothetical protein